MGMTTTQIDKKAARKYYKLEKVESGSIANYFYKLPKYNQVKRVDISDTKKVFFTMLNNDFIQVSY
jgi:hypothetical protein